MEPEKTVEDSLMIVVNVATKQEEASWESSSLAERRPKDVANTYEEEKKDDFDDHMSRKPDVQEGLCDNVKDIPPKNAPSTKLPQDQFHGNKSEALSEDDVEAQETDIPSLEHIRTSGKSKTSSVKVERELSSPTIEELMTSASAPARELVPEMVASTEEMGERVERTALVLAIQDAEPVGLFSSVEGTEKGMGIETYILVKEGPVQVGIASSNQDNVKSDSTSAESSQKGAPQLSNPAIFSSLPLAKVTQTSGFLRGPRNIAVPAVFATSVGMSISPTTSSSKRVVNYSMKKNLAPIFSTTPGSDCPRLPTSPPPKSPPRSIGKVVIPAAFGGDCSRSPASLANSSSSGKRYNVQPRIHIDKLMLGVTDAVDYYYHRKVSGVKSRYSRLKESGPEVVTKCREMTMHRKNLQGNANL
jgi:hypothetical protein